MKDGLSDPEIKHLQFYTSETIILRRAAAESERALSPQHQFRMINGTLVEEVVIPAGTPGVVVSVDALGLVLSFEDSDATLRFFAVKPDTITPPGRAKERVNHFTRTTVDTNETTEYWTVGRRLPNTSVIADQYLLASSVTPWQWRAAESCWVGEQKYGTHTFSEEGESAHAFLEIDPAGLEAIEKSRRHKVVMGRRLPQPSTADDGESR